MSAMTDAIVLSTPILTTVPRVELGAVGRWNISNIAGWEPTPDDMASAVAALECPAVRRPVLKLGHTGEQGQGDPAIGYIDNMAVTDDGQVLVGDYAGIPAWLATEDDAGQSVLASAYPDRSGEWEHDYVCQLGHTHPFVLHAMALLGVVRPGIGTLQSLHDLYANPPEMEPLMPAASLASADGQVSSAATTDDVRRAYYAGPGTNWDLYIREMYIDPPELIVQNDSDDSLTRVSYTIAADGTVEFADPQNIKVQYVAARAASSAPVVAFASHAEARPGTPPQAPVATSAGGSSTQETEAAPMTDLHTNLRQRLGIADENADEATLLAALDEALAEQTQENAPSGETPPALPEGTVVIEREQLDDLVAAASQGREARTQQLREQREALVSSAVRDGRISASRREHWLQQLEADPGSEAVLTSLAPGLVPVEQIGTTGSGEEHGDDAAYFELFPDERKGA